MDKHDNKQSLIIKRAMSIQQLSFEDMPVSKQLSQQTTPTPQNQTHETILAELAQNMQQQQQHRADKKLERIIKQKDSIINELSSKCGQLEREKKTLATINKTLTMQYNQIKQAFQRHHKETEEQGEKKKEEQQQTVKQMERMNELLKQQVAQLQRQNAKLQNRDQLQTQDFNRKIKRLQSAWEDKNKALERKLKVREEQQEKVEQLLSQKKKCYGQDLTQKQGRIAELIEANRSLQDSVLGLKETLAATEKKQKNRVEGMGMELMKEREKLEQLMKGNQEEIAKNQAFVSSLKTALDTFAESFNLQNTAQAPIQQIRQFKDNLQERIKHANMEQVTQLEATISSLKTSEQELSAKSKLLQEEAAFMKQLLAKKQQATEIIRQHLSQSRKQPISKPAFQEQCSKISRSPRPAKTFSSKSLTQSSGGSKWKENLTAFLDCKEKIDSFLGHSALESKYNSLETQPQPLLAPIDRSSSTNSCQLERFTPHFEKSHPNSFTGSTRNAQVKEQLTRQLSRKAKLEAQDCQKRRADWERRRQSLVYVMYRRLPAQGKQEQLTPSNAYKVRPNPTMHSSRQASARRSGSMKDLVRQSCRQRLD